MSSGQVGPLKILYSLIGISILLYSGYIVGILVMHIWHKNPKSRHIDAGMTKEEKLFKEMIDGVETVHNVTAYKNMDGRHRTYNFHKTERLATPDSRNLCVSCHGDIPHDKKKETRAFLNMHSFFMACETCHIRSESRSETRFIWYNKTTGEESEKIDLSLFLGNTPFKLMPVKKDRTRFYDSEQMRKYVAKFKSKLGEMIPSEKSAALEVVHRPMNPVKDAVKCDECHKSDRDGAYLPFERIGYPERRTNQLVGNEVVGMIDKYKKFYIPNLLIPKEAAESEK